MLAYKVLSSFKRSKDGKDDVVSVKKVTPCLAYESDYIRSSSRKADQNVCMGDQETTL